MLFCFSTSKYATWVLVVHVFKKKTQKTPQADIDLGKRRLMELRARFMLAIREFANKQELTQAELAEVLQVSQSRVSDLLSGKVEKFSIGMLIKFAMRIGLSIEVSVKSKSLVKKGVPKGGAQKLVVQKAAPSRKKAKSA